MRKQNSIKNAFASLFSNVFTIVIGLISQAIFIKTLGTEYLGLNSLFTNIISMLCIVELGLGSAIIYNLYKPISDNDIKTIQSLMKFYKKCYHVISAIVLILGCSLIPFLSFFTSSVTIKTNINAIYILFLLDAVCSYLLSYKRSILYANQKNYIINIIHIGYTLVLNVSQLLILIYTANYYIYLVIKIVCRLIENTIITCIVNKMYHYLTEKGTMKLNENLRTDIIKKIKALFFHKIAGFIVSSSDNLVISRMLGVVMVGLYSNYYMVINSIQTIFGQIITSTTASIGDMLVNENCDKCFLVFRRIRFLNFCIATFSSTCIFILMTDFIKIWIGESYVLPVLILLVLTINLFQQLMRYTYLSFKEAAGIFYEDRFIPLCEAIINIVFSILLCNKYGLLGVFIGTIISSMVLWCYSYPKFVYKKLFHQSYLKYIKETFIYLVIFFFILFLTSMITKIIIIKNIYMNFVKNILICIIVPSVLLLVLFYNRDILNYYLHYLKKQR